MTYMELLESGRNYLEDHGIADAATDAGILLEYLTGMGHGELLMHGRDEVVAARVRDDRGHMGDEREAARDVDAGGSVAVAKYRDMLERRAKHVPVQYITGEADFMGLKFKVSPEVLIPRFDTEFLVEEMMRVVEDGSSVLDMCTGSGCILLSLMKYKNGINGTGVDVSNSALDIARENERLIFGTHDIESPSDVSLHNIKTPSNNIIGDEADDAIYGMHEPVNWIESDMFESVKGKFDYMVSNPPYIQSDVIDGLMPEVRNHEPRVALDGDGDGLKFYRIIAKNAHKYLHRHGRLFLEIGYDEGEAVKTLLDEHGYVEIQLLKDYSGNDRVVIAKWS